MKRLAIVLAVAAVAIGCGRSQKRPQTAASTSSQPQPSAVPVRARGNATPATSSSVAQPVAGASAVPGGRSPDREWVWSFEEDRDKEPPAGFLFGRTGSGAHGKWAVRTETGAPSGSKVVAQTDADETDFRFPVAVAKEPILRDVNVSVRCKPVSGKVDQACGLVLRYQNENDYYVVRANALEHNVRLYAVKAGRRRQLAGSNAQVISGVWHSLSIQVEGDHFVVTFDDNQTIDAHDSTFTGAGKVGLWTKADSVTYFDDLVVKGK